MNKILDTVVIGGGQAGLGAGYHLQNNKLKFLILEASDQPVGSWPHYYDSLRLFSPAKLSSLSGMKFPGNQNRYPTRDEVIDYLQNYLAEYQLPVQTKRRVESVEKEDGIFRIRTTIGIAF